MHMDKSQEAFCAEIYKENAGRASRSKHFGRACAVEMHMDMLQECENSQVKCRRTRPDGSHDCDPQFVRACAIEMQMDTSREFSGKMPQIQVAGQTLCEPAQSKRTWRKSQEQVYAEIYREKRRPPPQMEHPDQAPASTLTVRAPQCGHIVWGKVCRLNQVQAEVGSPEASKQPCR
jgi:hypothetical protein